MPGRAGRPETGHRIPLDPTAGAGCLLRRRRLGPREAGEAPRERTGARAMRAEPVPRLAEKLNRLRPRHQRGAGRRGATAPRTQPRRWRGGSGGVGPFAPPPPRLSPTPAARSLPAGRGRCAIRAPGKRGPPAAPAPVVRPGGSAPHAATDDSDGGKGGGSDCAEVSPGSGRGPRAGPSPRLDG